MINFRTFIFLLEAANITSKEIKDVEAFADKLFLKMGLDVKFTKHFKDRLYDKRNKKPINKLELLSLFTRTFNQYKSTINKMKPDDQAVIKDLVNNLNLPFVISFEKKVMQLVPKTIMRKKDFKTSNKQLMVT